MYACARRIQMDLKQTICFNTFFLNKYEKDSKLSLEHYKLNEDVIFEKNKPLESKIDTHKLYNELETYPNLFFNLYKNRGIYVWMKATYKKIPIQLKQKNHYLIGYWQCNKYFNDIRNTLLDELIPKYPLLPENKNFYDLIKSTESVCVSIRRGDYLSETYRKKFFVCDKEFFIEGVQKIRQDIPNAVLFIFSDEIDWVRENIDFGGIVYFESGKDPVWEKLRIMSLCKHFIISNSTFSWWAQYLSTNKNKIVYAPSSWFADGTKADIYEDNWRYIEV